MSANDFEEEVQIKMIPSDEPGADRKGSFKRKKISLNKNVNKLAMHMKKLRLDFLFIFL